MALNVNLEKIIEDQKRKAEEQKAEKERLEREQKAAEEKAKEEEDLFSLFEEEEPAPTNESTRYHIDVAAHFEKGRKPKKDNNNASFISDPDELPSYETLTDIANTLPPSEMKSLFREYGIIQKRVRDMNDAIATLRARMENTTKPLSLAPTRGGGGGRPLESMTASLVTLEKARDEQVALADNLKSFMLKVIETYPDKDIHGVDVKQLIKYRYIECKSIDWILKYTNVGRHVRRTQLYERINMFFNHVRNSGWN